MRNKSWRQIPALEGQKTGQVLDEANVPLHCCREGKIGSCLYTVLCRLSRSSHVGVFATLRTAARQAPLCLGFSRQEYWSGLPCPPPGDLPDPGIEPTCLVSPSLAGGLFTTSPMWQALAPMQCTEFMQWHRELPDDRFPWWSSG